MISYLIFFFSVFIITWVIKITNPVSNKLLIIPISLSVFFTGLRGNIGTDTFAYRTFFKSIWNDDDFVSQGIIFAFEPGFIAFSKLIKSFVDNDQFYIFSISLLYGILFYQLLKRIQNKHLFFIFYLSSYFIMFNFNLLRFGIAIMFLGLSIMDKNKYHRILFFGLGMSFHFSIIIATVFFVKRRYLLFYLASLILLIGFTKEFIETKVNSYLVDFLLKKSFNFEWTIIIEILLLFYVIRKNDIDLKRYNLFYCIIIYLLFRWFGYLNDIISRLSYVMGFLVYLTIFSTKFTKSTRNLIVVFSLFFTYRSLSFIYKSDSAMDSYLIDSSGSGMLHSQTKWIPYKFFWE